MGMEALRAPCRFPASIGKGMSLTSWGYTFFIISVYDLELKGSLVPHGPVLGFNKGPLKWTKFPVSF